METNSSLYYTMRFNFLYVDRYVFSRGWSYPESHIPYCMLRYILKGEAVFIINGQQLVVREGEVSYIPDGCMLECYSLGDEFSFISIRFNSTTRLDGNDFITEFFHIPFVTKQAGSEVAEYFWEVYRNATSQNTSRYLRVRGNLELILAALVERAPGSQIEDSGEPVASFAWEAIRHRESRSLIYHRDPRIQAVIDYLISNPTETLDADALSQMADMSPSNFRRLFRKQTGKAPRDFIKEIRMTAAARLLLTSNKGVSAIAYEVGYYDLNYFSRMFKSVFGVSPRAYRKASRD